MEKNKYTDILKVEIWKHPRCFQRLLTLSTMFFNWIYLFFNSLASSLWVPHIDVAGFYFLAQIIVPEIESSSSCSWDSGGWWTATVLSIYVYCHPITWAIECIVCSVPHHCQLVFLKTSNSTCILCPCPQNFVLWTSCINIWVAPNLTWTTYSQNHGQYIPVFASTGIVGTVLGLHCLRIFHSSMSHWPRWVCLSPASLDLGEDIEPGCLKPGTF